MGFIYKITNNVNGKIYVGMTINSVEHRFNQHFRELKYKLNNELTIPYFHRALNKYGVDNFKIEVLEENDNDKLVDREIYWIDKLNSNDKSIGYNLSEGGESPTMTEELKEKLSKIQTKRLKNPTTRAKALRGLRKGTRKWKDTCRVRRLIKNCPVCNSEFQVANHNRNTKYCSRKCKDDDYKSWFDYKKVAENGRLGNEARSLNTKELRDKIKVYTLHWALKNAEYVEDIKFNRVTPSLEPLLNEVEKKFGIKDIRTVAQSVCNSNSKKLLLTNLKDYIKMYAEPDQN